MAGLGPGRTLRGAAPEQVGGCEGWEYRREAVSDADQMSRGQKDQSAMEIGQGRGLAPSRKLSEVFTIAIAMNQRAEDLLTGQFLLCSEPLC
jgi:hypothetical protein